MTEHEPRDDLARTDPRYGRPRPDPAMPTVHPDWDPRGTQVQVDPRRAYDQMRRSCPVAMGSSGAWTFFKHADVRAAALDDDTFSSAVSAHLQVPNGMDGAEHTRFRRLIDSYLDHQQMVALAPTITTVATRIAAGLHVPGPIDAVELGSTFAVQAQSAWLGWPAELQDELVSWVAENHAASRALDRERMAAVAQRFDRIITSVVTARRELGDAAPLDVTTELIRDRSLGRELTDAEITSILRNWTGGDLGSMALCTGVLLTYLADHRDLQLRVRSGVSDTELDAIIDEVLRIDSPFTANRRVTTRHTVVGGRPIGPGERVFLNWTAANRDPDAFGDPDEFDPDGNAAHNLVYGIGRHVCPGRELATMELRALLRAVLAVTEAILPDTARTRRRGRPPVGGYESAPLLLR
ncbi:cytochrome P450 [Ruania albidiflava]|uniref:cytochrome P450 n=1 Tax=Ruania albidiflava TaxID=366586 RepID=UPI0003B2F0AE|nr:cytochrome P450 [Ruania albidiflava]